MTVRIFVVAATLIVGVLFGGALTWFERIPEPVIERSEYKVEDAFLDMRFVVGTRRSNLTEFGLPEKIIGPVEDRLLKIQKRDRNGELLQSMKASPDVAGVLCTNSPPLPSRYAVTGILLSGDRGKRREVVSFDRVRNRLKIQEGYAPTDLELMYVATELQPNASPDAYAMNIAALLLGQETERLENEGEWGGGIFGPPDFISFLNRKAEIELDLIEFFAQMLYLHEVARDPKSEFCGVRTGASFSDEE